jgi:hypothetical protein
LTPIGGYAALDNVNFTEFTAAVPEPSTWAMMILGFAGVGFMAYRRRNSALHVALSHSPRSALQRDRLRAVVLFVGGLSALPALGTIVPGLLAYDN